MYDFQALNHEIRGPLFSTIFEFRNYKITGPPLYSIHLQTLHSLVNSILGQVYDDEYSDYGSVSTESNEVLVEEIPSENQTFEITVGNISYSLEHLQPYNVSIELNLPDTTSLKVKINIEYLTPTPPGCDILSDVTF